MLCMWIFITWIRFWAHSNHWEHLSTHLGETKLEGDCSKRVGVGATLGISHHPVVSHWWDVEPVSWKGQYRLKLKRSTASFFLLKCLLGLKKWTFKTLQVRKPADPNAVASLFLCPIEEHRRKYRTVFLLLYTGHKTDVAVFSFRQVAAGRTRSWLTLSSWWSWAPPWSRPRPPARSERPTFQMRYSGDTSFRPLSHCLLQGNMWLILHTLTKWPKQSPPSSLNSPWPQAPPLTKMTRRTRRRCDWRRATEVKGGGKKGDAWEIAARWVYASVMSKEGRRNERNRKRFWKVDLKLRLCQERKKAALPKKSICH